VVIKRWPTQHTYESRWVAWLVVRTGTAGWR
jgi:hypothetical protein